MTLTSEQILGARAMLRMDQRGLAERAGTSVETIKRLEGKLGPVPAYEATIAAIQAALESAGVEFTNGGEPGVKLKAKPHTIAAGDLNASNDE
jgi:transcriptional regulator with XRE-family HTH domain